MLFPALLFTHIIFIGIWNLSKHNLEKHWYLLAFVLILLLPFIIMPVWHIIKEKYYLDPRTYYQAFFTMAFLFAFYAVFTFITGHTASKYNSVPVPRIFSLHYLYIAIIYGTIGAVPYFIKLKRGRKKR